ncbi:MAG: putative solute:sodium symporter small subunit [Pseudoalteromonas rhizosphaerae]|jgi:putative solute:sodium symporter small subunit|tara:strand:- start:1878 stop:2237 length:360 start_codon:yes stop_codon:yes gene_type:complete
MVSIQYCSGIAKFITENKSNTSLFTDVKEEIKMAFKDEEQAKAYWAENISLLFKLLAVWFVVSFGFGIILVDVLNEVRFFGFKLGFWFSQQGAIYTFVALIFVYVFKMNTLDKKYGVDE